MILAEDYVYSKSAVARMMNIASFLVVRVEKWANCAFVIIKGKRPRFWKKFDFLLHFADWRRSQSKELVVDRLMPDVFAVINEKKKSKYVVKIKPDAIVCTCEDYKNQVKFLGKPGVCKHGYAVLKSLGVNKLSEYIKDNIYQQALENFNKEKSTSLKIERSDAYSFKVESNGNTYYSDLRPDFIKCSCKDSRNVQKFCIHGYAVLSYLGFNGNQQIKNYKLDFEWIVKDYELEEEAKQLNQAMNDEGEELDRLRAEREAIEAARLTEEQDAMDCLFTAQSW